MHINSTTADNRIHEIEEYHYNVLTSQSNKNVRMLLNYKIYIIINAETYSVSSKRYQNNILCTIL